ncbi:pyrroline-5-carboxylate reductase [Mycobacterium kansasii 824]|nr:pyrroline-5-carboxylate reductase [Mycobacterium kansasii 824]
MRHGKNRDHRWGQYRRSVALGFAARGPAGQGPGCGRTDPERAKYLASTYSVLVTSVSDAIEHATFVVVAVKPADVETVIGDLAAAATGAGSDSVEQVFVTVAAGVTTSYFESKLPAGTPVIRAMPNAAALVGAGVTALAKGRFVTPQQLKEVSALFDAVGVVLNVPEQQLDAVTAVSGSGPAYFFLLVEALVDAGVAVGLSRQVATELTAQTLAGSTAMLLERMEQERPAAGEPAGCGSTPRRCNCGRRSPPPVGRPPPRCASWKKAGFGGSSTRPSTPPKAALSS